MEKAWVYIPDVLTAVITRASHRTLSEELLNIRTAHLAGIPQDVFRSNWSLQDASRLMKKRYGPKDRLKVGPELRKKPLLEEISICFMN